MTTKEFIEKEIAIATQRRNHCESDSTSWYFYEGQIAAYTNVYVHLD